MKRTIYLIFSILALLSSCEDVTNDYRYPSVITDYACLVTNHNGEPNRLTLDNGYSYPITFTNESDKQQSSYRVDTTYRVVCTYELTTDSIAQIHSIAQTMSIIPTLLQEGETLYQDPVFLQSCWISGGFLNMTIELKALDGKHYIGFIDTTPSEMHGKEITFYHNAHDDIESYRQKLYASIPLDTALQLSDTVRFIINTYEKGIIQQEFVL